jgi:putative ABC transport system permease protein
MKTFRVLAKSPGFSIVVVLTVALGIASVTAIYSVADAVVFRPLPVRDEANVAWVWSTRPDRDSAFFSIPNFLDLQRDNRTTAGFAPVTPLGFSLTGLGEAERVSGWRTTAALFPLLGLVPHVGQLPPVADDPAAAPPAVMLGHAFWQRRFGGDPAIVGRALTLNGQSFPVAGILPPDFLLPGWPVDVIITQPLETDSRRAARGTHFLRGIARLAPGITLAQARAEFTELNQQLVKNFPADNATLTAPRLVPLRDEITGGYRQSVLLLFAAAGALLLIMCANLAGLLAARALARRRDAALCSALGASPSRLLHDYLLEGLLLAALGGVLALGLNAGTLDWLVQLAPANLPRASLVGVNWRVLTLAAGCTLLTGLGVGLAPALRLARSAPQDVLKSHGPGAGTRSLARRALLSAQVALCATLLVGTGLLVRSFQKLLAADPGFNPRGVLVAQVAVVGANARTVDAINRFADECGRRLATLPGVGSTSVTSILPLSGINTRTEFARVDRPPAKPTDLSSAANRYVHENYFATVGIPLRAGRDFTASDDAKSRPVIVIDEALAARDWPGENPLGKTVSIREGAQSREFEVIGIVGNAKNFSLEETGTPTLYFSARQMPALQLAFLAGRMTYVARTSGDPAALKETARRELRALDADAAVTLRTLEEATAWATAPRIFNLRLLGFFSLAALLLASLGLYASTVQAVTVRTREIGVRLALGADHRQVVREILRESAVLAAAGLLAGLALAALLAPLAAHLLYGVAAFDLPTYAAVATVLTPIILAAAWLPARRATQVDPLVALRTE